MIMEEQKRPGIPEGRESEYYAGDMTGRHPKEEKPSVTVPGRAAMAFRTAWEAFSRGILLILSLGGAYALTDPAIRERLREMLVSFVNFTGGH